MKKKLLLIIFLMISSFTFAQKINYDISGKWKANPGEMIYLGLNEDDTALIDSTVINTDSMFQLKGEVDGMCRAYLISGKKVKVAVFLDGTPIKASVGKKGSIHVSGSERQTLLENIKGKMLTIYLLKLSSMFAMSDAIKKKSSQEHIDSLNQSIEDMKIAQDKAMLNYVDSIKDSEVAPCFIHDYFIQNLGSFEMATLAFNKLSDRVKKCSTGKILAKELYEMGQHVVGGIVPDFTSNTPDGKKMNLYSLRGHIVIIDFWASWCGPCLREVPNLKRIYEQYHPKGLEILGVSLDRTYDPWVKAIKDKGLVWHHVSSLKEFEDPIARQFHVNAIPRMFILDEKGKIIAQDLRGEELANKIKELFKGK